MEGKPYESFPFRAVLVLYLQNNRWTDHKILLAQVTMENWEERDTHRLTSHAKLIFRQLPEVHKCTKITSSGRPHRFVLHVGNLEKENQSCHNKNKEQQRMTIAN